MVLEVFVCFANFFGLWFKKRFFDFVFIFVSNRRGRGARFDKKITQSPTHVGAAGPELHEQRKNAKYKDNSKIKIVLQCQPLQIFRF